MQKPYPTHLTTALATILMVVIAHANPATSTLEFVKYLDQIERLVIPDGSMGGISPSVFDGASGPYGQSDQSDLVGPGYEAATLAQNGIRHSIRSDLGHVTGRWITLGAIGNGCDRSVSTIYETPDGEIYVGGRFRVCGDQRVDGIAQYDPESGAFLPVGAVGPDTRMRIVRAITTYQGDLYIGGLFGSGPPDRSGNLKRWNGESWHHISASSSFNSGANALAVFNGSLYVGGSFTSGDGQNLNRIARWDGADWHPVGGAENGTNGWVNSMGAVSDRLYVGGGFNEAGGSPANRVAYWDGTDWSAIVEEGVNGVSSIEIYSIEVVSDDEVYFGGLFLSQAGPVAVSNVAMWNGSNWAALDDGDGVNGVACCSIQHMTHVENELYVAGDFQHLSDWSTPVNGAARWDGQAWTAAADDQHLDFQIMLSAIHVLDDGLLVGGFQRPEWSDGDQGINWIGKFGEGQWQTVGENDGLGANDRVRAIASLGDDVFIGGEFTQIAGIEANGIVRYRDGEWHPLISNGVNGLGLLFSQSGAYALTVIGDNLYVCGNFIHIGDLLVRSIARWDGESWSALGDGPDVGFGSGTGCSLYSDGDDLYVGRRFMNSAGGVTVEGVARWDGESWHALGAGVNETAASIVGYDDDIYFGGFFTEAGGLPAGRIAAWDGEEWSYLTEQGINGLNWWAWTLASSAEGVYAGGAFSFAGPVQVSRIALWDGTQWHALDDGGVGVDDTVEAMLHDGEHLYVAGRFRWAGGTYVNGFARWNGSEWEPVGHPDFGGFDSQVDAIHRHGDMIFAVGDFSRVGDAISSGLAIFEFLSDEIFDDRFEGEVNGIE